MAIQRQNINKHIASQPKIKIESSNGNSGAEGDMMSAIMPIAQQYVENMPKKYKLAIVGVVYFLLAGIVATVQWTIKLINLIF